MLSRSWDKEALRKENEQLRRQLNMQHEDDHLLDGFKKERIQMYILILFLPPIGLYRIWKKTNTMHTAAKMVWSMYACIIMGKLLFIFLS